LTARWSRATGRRRGQRGWLELEAFASVDVAFALLFEDAAQLLDSAAAACFAVALGFGFVLPVVSAFAWLVSAQRLSQLLDGAASRGCAVAVGFGFVLPDVSALVSTQRLSQVLDGAASGRCAVAVGFGFVLPVVSAFAWFVSPQRLA